MWWTKVGRVVDEMDQAGEHSDVEVPLSTVRVWKSMLESALGEADNEVDDAYEAGFKQGMEWMREAMKRDD